MPKTKKAMHMIRLLLLVLALVLVSNSHLPMNVTDNGVAVSDYDKGSDFGDDPVYEMALNKNGTKIFKDPWRALRKVKYDCADAISAIRWEHKIPLTLGRWTYKSYMNYGRQMVTEDKELQRQGTLLSGVLDVFENSYKK